MLLHFFLYIPYVPLKTPHCVIIEEESLLGQKYCPDKKKTGGRSSEHQKVRMRWHDLLYFVVSSFCVQHSSLHRSVIRKVLVSVLVSCLDNVP